MAMNADLLVPGSGVFYVRGTTGERVRATVVGLSSFPECVAISAQGIHNITAIALWRFIKGTGEHPFTQLYTWGV